MQSSELFNLNFAREFMSKKGVSLLDQQVRVTQAQTKPAGMLGRVRDTHAYLRLWQWLDQVVVTHLPQFLLADSGTR